MIKFFRKIRQNLLLEGKIGPYLRYAAGEIILVVIGILIALQINNWNQNRINEKTEKVYLLGLKEEFQISRMKLEELMAVNQQTFEGARSILSLAISNDNPPEEAAFSALLYQTFSVDIAFNPNNSFLYELINSGNLNILANTDLRTKLTNWISTLEDIARQEEELGSQRMAVLDMFRNNEYSLRTIIDQTGVRDSLGLPTTIKETSNLPLLRSRKFENNVLMFLITSYATERAHYQPLMHDLEAILHLINRELDKR